MSVLCVKCVSEKASLECSQCGQVFDEGSAPLCEGCSNDIHQTLSAPHNITSIACKDGSAKTDKIENDNSEWLASVRSCEEMIHEVQANRQLLKEQVKKALDDFKQLLDTRQAALFSNFDLVCERKVKVLSQHLEQLDAVATSHVEECSPPPPPLPAMPGNTACGFVPPMATLHHATACLMTDCSDEVGEGDRLSVTAIGSIDQSGCFSVRILPDRDGLQDIMLQNISNSLEIDHALSSHPRPPNLHSGLLCTARYTVDQRWYRAKVVDPSSSRGKIKVYFLDHGNTEEVPTSSIGPLHEKYQVFPFQMLQCCFSVEPKFSYNKREVRWKFNDLTHGRSLTAVIISRLPDNYRGKLFFIELWDETTPQPLDVGASVLAVAEAMAGHQQKDSIKYRDVRYKDQPLPPNSKQIITSSANNTNSTTPSGSLAQTTSTQPSKPPSAQRTAPQPTPSSQQQPLSTSLIPEQANTSQLLPQSKQKSEISATLEQAKKSQPHVLASFAIIPESELSQPPNAPEKAKKCQSSTAKQSELNQPSSESVQDEDKSQSVNAPFSSTSSTIPSQPPSTTDKVNDSQTAPPPSHTQSSTTNNNSVVHSESSTQPSVISKTDDTISSLSSVPPLSSHAPLEPSAPTHTSHTSSQPSSDITKSGQPVQQSQPSVVEPLPSLDAEDSHAPLSRSQVNKEGVSSDKAPPSGDEVGVAKEEPGLINQDSSMDLKKEMPDSTTVEGRTEKGGDSSAAEEELLRLMHPSIVPGAELDVYVTTSLSPDGSFWAQLSLEDPSYDAMAEELKMKLSESRDIMTPVFFNAGDLCAGLYSEDDNWYRARVVGAREGVFTVRYLDFGNSEEREARHLAPLRSEFKELPFQAVHCSIVSEDHTSFTQPEVDKFNQIVPTEEPVNINVLKLEGTTAYVEVLLKLAGGKSVDLTEEVYSADVSVFQSMDFGPSKIMDVPSNESVPSANLPLPLSIPSDTKPSEKTSLATLPSPLTLPTTDILTHPSNWADEMDAIQSPQDDGFLTLPGQDSRSHSERSKSPSPSPAETAQTRHQPQPQREAGPVDSVRSAESLSSRDRRKEREGSRSISPRPIHTATAIRHPHDDRDTRRAVSPATRSGSGIGASRSAPRLNMGMATKQILSGIGHGVPNRASREGRRRERGEGPPPPIAGEKMMGNQHPLEQNHVTSGERSPSPRRFPASVPSQGSQSPDKHSTPPSRRRSPDPDIIQLFVKNIPSSMSPSDVSKLFATFGKVHKFMQDPQRKQVVYVLMSSENAQKAINGLHGKAISKNCHPLVVEQSKEKRI